MYQYTNGNRVIRISPTGLKMRLKPVGDNSPFNPTRPEMIDINLSYRCTIGCSYCYLSALDGGAEFLFDEEFLKQLFLSAGYENYVGMEIAMNYNDGQNSEMTQSVIEFFKNHDMIPNLTVHYKTFVKEHTTIMSYLKPYNIGISVTSKKQIDEVNEIIRKFKYKNTVVFHIIDGVFPKRDLYKLESINLLILGFKTVGRGREVKDRYKDRFYTIDDILPLFEKNRVGFDTLALQTISGLKEFSEEKSEFVWEPDGFISFYIDLVTKTFSISSTCEKKYPIEENDNIITIYKKVRNLIENKKEVV